MTKAQKALIDAIPAEGYSVTLWGSSIFSSNLPKGTRRSSLEALVASGALRAVNKGSTTTYHARERA